MNIIAQDITSFHHCTDLWSSRVRSSWGHSYRCWYQPRRSHVQSTAPYRKHVDSRIQDLPNLQNSGTLHVHRHLSRSRSGPGSPLHTEHIVQALINSFSHSLFKAEFKVKNISSKPFLIRLNSSSKTSALDQT